MGPVAPGPARRARARSPRGDGKPTGAGIMRGHHTMPYHPRLLAAAAFSFAVGPLAAQALQLDVTGGSLPGALAFDCHPANVPGELMVVVPSGSAGPTSLTIVDPNDFRDLAIGIDLLGLAWAGLAGPDGHFRVQLAMPAAPALQDQVLFFQAVTFAWTPTLVDRISNGNVVRFANAGAFRDRLVFSLYDRAFATVLPRRDGKWLLAGGARGLLLAQQAWATTEIFDLATDSSSLGPQLNAPRSLHTATELPNGTWLIAGGVDQNNDPQATCEVYDPVQDLFLPVASMATPRMGHTATLLPTGLVLVTGGIQAMPTTPTQLEPIHQTVASTELYDPGSNTWIPGPSLATPRAAHAAITRPDGKVLLAGGISWDPVIILGWSPAVRRSTDLYDPFTNTIVPGPQMANARSLTDPVDLGNGRWLLAGGINGISIIPLNPGNPTATAEIYDAGANTWTSVGAMATARGNHKAWALGNGQFLLAGGANGSILSPTSLASTEVFSTATNTFSPGPPMNLPRAGAAAFRTPQGQVHLFGGASTGGSITTSTEWYFF